MEWLWLPQCCITLLKTCMNSLTSIFLTWFKKKTPILYCTGVNLSLSQLNMHVTKSMGHHVLLCLDSKIYLLVHGLCLETNGTQSAIAIEVTFVSGTMKIRIVLCLPCVFTTWANWHSASVLSRAPSLPWWQWQPASAWHVKMTKQAKGYLDDTRIIQHNMINRSVKKDVFLDIVTAVHFAFRGHQPLLPSWECIFFQWAVKEAISSWKEEIRFFECISSTGLNFFKKKK